MALTPVNLARISFNQRAFNLRESLRTNQVDWYRTQNQLVTGLRFLQPSEDPLRAASAAQLERRLERLALADNNLRSVNGVLTEVESAAQEAIDLFEQARTLVVQCLSDSTSDDERAALVPVVNSVIDQLISVGNRQYLNTFLFAGHENSAPFELTNDGVIYRGDANRRATIVDSDLSTDTFTVPGQEFFSAVSGQVQGAVDLDPALTLETRISDLDGAANRGVQLGRIVVTAGAERTEIDLTGCATVGDVIDRLNAELPNGVTADIDERCIILRQGLGVDVSILDVGAGRTAVDLGLAGTFNAPERAGPDLNPRLTLRTQIVDLQAGAGVDLSATFVIRNGPHSATIDLSAAETLEDVLNAINHANIGAWARLGSDGATLEVVNRVSGTDFAIEENGGQTATNLGLRSFYGGTTLASLNDGSGVRTVAGNDLRIVTANGTTIDVDLDGALTIQDVIDRLNAAGGGAIAADLAATGNGLSIRDLTVGAGTLTVQALNDSPAAQDLGLDVAAAGNQILGRDVYPVRVDSPFTALLELRDGMITGDRLTLMAAGERIERVLEDMQRVQGQMASQARMMADRAERVETENVATQTLLSDVRDVDFTDATVRFQQLQNALQANLTTASKILNLSLLDYLR